MRTHSHIIFFTTSKGKCQKDEEVQEQPQVHTLKGYGRVQKRGKHPHSGQQKMQEGRQGLGEEEEDRGTQAGLVGLQVCDPLEVWGRE